MPVDLDVRISWLGHATFLLTGADGEPLLAAVEGIELKPGESFG